MVTVVLVAIAVARDGVQPVCLPGALSRVFPLPHTIAVAAGETARPTVEEADEEGGVVEVGVFGYEQPALSAPPLLAGPLWSD